MTRLQRLGAMSLAAALLAVVAILLSGRGPGTALLPGLSSPTEPQGSPGRGTDAIRVSEVADGVHAAGVAEAAVHFSQDRWDGAGTVVVVVGQGERLALAGAGMAAALGSPVLIADGFDVTDLVVDEVRRLGATRVVVLEEVERDATRARLALERLALEVTVVGPTPEGPAAVDLAAAAWIQAELGEPIDLVVTPSWDMAREAIGPATRRTAAGVPTLVVLLDGVAGRDGLMVDGRVLVVGAPAGRASPPAAQASGEGVDELLLSPVELAAALESRWKLDSSGVLLVAPGTPPMLASAWAGAAALAERVVAVEGPADASGLSRLRGSSVVGAPVRSLNAGEVLDERVAAYAEALSVWGSGLLAPVKAEGRLGLHVTRPELETWRHRAEAGPFPSAGDVAPGSPGDWERLLLRSRAVRADPEDFLWEGPGGDGCVQGRASTRDDPPASSGWIRDLAFTSLVRAERGDRAVVARLLLEQARVDNLDFHDRDRWCLGEINDLNPGFEIANWLTSMLYAFEYVEIGDRLGEDAVLTPSEAHEIVDWLAAAAVWMNEDTNRSVRRNFEHRLSLPGPPYPLTEDRLDERGGIVVLAEVDAEVGSIARYYNNRRAQLARYVGLVSLHVVMRDDGFQPDLPPDASAEVLLDDAVRYMQDWLVYSVYPEGFTGDFERWKDDLPDLGWFYGVATAAPATTLADALARAGDRRLLEYVTDDGAQGTEGRPDGEAGKSLPWLVRTLFGYVEGSILRHVPGGAGDDGGLVDGRDEEWLGIHHHALLPLNRHTRDARLEVAVLWPAAGPVLDPAGFGQYDVHHGDWGTLPAVLFMFGLEGPATLGVS